MNEFSCVFNSILSSQISDFNVQYDRMIQFNKKTIKRGSPSRMKILSVRIEDERKVYREAGRQSDNTVSLVRIDGGPSPL